MDSCTKFMIFASMVISFGMFFSFWLGRRCERDEWVRKHATQWDSKEEGDEHETNHF